MEFGAELQSPAPPPAAMVASNAPNGVSVEAIEEQRARLEADLAAATARKLAAQHRAAQLDAEAKELLRDELASSRETLAEIERQHAETLELLRTTAQTEIERILSDARHRAASVTADIDGPGTDVG